MKSSALQLLALASFAPCLISSQDAPLPPEDPVSTSLVFVTHGSPRPVILLPRDSATSLADVPGNYEPNPTSLPVTEPVAPDQPVAISVLDNKPGSEPADQPSEPQPTTLPEEATPGAEETAVFPSTGPEEGDALPETSGAGQLPSASPSDPVPTSVNDGNAEPNPGEDPGATESGSLGTNSPGDGDAIVSSAAISTSQDENPSPIDDNTKTITQTDDDGVIILIFPGGWKWSRLDGLKGGPLPTGNPKPINNGEDGERTSTRIGSCAPVTGCVSGEQSTTTTIIASDVSRITGVLEKDNSGREDVDLGPMEEDTVKYFAEMFKKWGISSNSTEAEPPKPSCDMTAWISRNLTYEDSVGDAKRAVATGAERRSLWRRQSKCSFHEFDFEWTGGDGSCDLSCSKAYSQLQTQCHRSLYFAGLATKGSIDVGCSTYSYRVSKKFDSASTPLPSATSQAKTKTAEPKPTRTDVKFEIRKLQCNNKDDFRGHADISSIAAYNVIFDACTHSDEENLYMTPGSEPYVKEFKGTDSHKRAPCDLVLDRRVQYEERQGQRLGPAR
ncbi:hypothetical protein FAGAP_2297 [Fusarium agapanthi]|uniref:Uncharacterized protein n=1 Tax=Fusarium agapanthi TaxID=1803897 RepID=A0A9P5BHH9_9HYPO|nr:hypothetical protein FAGAP_2297 [Fusarium agapanthi]